MGNRKLKFIIGIVLGLLVFEIINAVYSYNNETIEKSLNKIGGASVNIIYKENTGNGSLVFYNRGTEDSLYVDFFKRSLTGWKYVYGGVQGDIKRVNEEFGLSYVYYPKVSGTPFPIFFGIIGNPDIKSVKVIEEKRNIGEVARIISANNKRIWLLYASKFEGSDFQILGLSAKQEVLTKIGYRVP